MNKINPTVTIVLDRERKLILDLNAMVAFEEKTGKNLLQGSVTAEMSASDLRALLWACLKADDPSLTLDQVGALITAENMGDVAQGLGEAWKRAVPEASKEAAPLARKSRTG